MQIQPCFSAFAMTHARITPCAEACQLLALGTGQTQTRERYCVNIIRARRLPFDSTGARRSARDRPEGRTGSHSNAYRASFDKPSVLVSRSGFWSGSCPCERCAMGTGLEICLREPCPSSSAQWALVSGVAGACPGLSHRRSLQTGVAADLSRQFVSNKDLFAGPVSDPQMGVQRPMPHCKRLRGPF